MHRTLLTIFATGLLFLGATFVEKGGRGETPQQALLDVRKLYENRDWDRLIRERCADAPYAAAAAELRVLSARLESEYSDRLAYLHLLAKLEMAATMKPKLAEEGRVAIFAINGETLSLTLMDTGQWGVRL